MVNIDTKRMQNTFLKFTNHYIQDTLPKRPYLKAKEGELEKIIKNPCKKSIQMNGRISYWGYVKEEHKYLRIITLEDGLTVHTAYFDRNFKL